tara:strand:+ start:40 stop:213 length:174 start_codon:yes stop_codon:yes gene_type:complete
MQLHKKTSIGKYGFLIRVTLLFVFVSIVIVLIDQIDFPAPNKKIEKIIPNENLKIVK